jgi:leucyl/phenylalanyl-tRNA--protein transferase
MPFALTTETGRFPPVQYARSDGLLATGGDLSPARLLNAYRLGIFPWYDSPPVLWWFPDPRFVIFPGELHVSGSMKQLLRKAPFTYSVNAAFRQVMRCCGTTRRKGQSGTWITEEMMDAYTALHRMGHAVSVEAWRDGELAGGLYGVRLGRVFFGESMFTRYPNASKAAFIHYVGMLQKEGVALIDCQVYTTHLASLGARLIPASEFSGLLSELVP